MKLSRRLCLGTILSGASLALLTAPVSAEGETVLRYATFYASTDFYEVPSVYFMEEVTKRSGGRITFEPYYGGALLKATEVSGGVSAGAADIGVTVPGAFEPTQYPLTSVTLPFITSNPYATTAAFAELFETNTDLQDEFERHGQHLLYAMGSGENTLWSNKPVDAPADLEGMRIRVTLGIADGLKALGATPVGIPWSEALDIIQRGGVDGVSATPFDQSVKTGLADIIPYVSDTAGMGSYAAVTVVMNQGVYDGLSDEDRAIVDEVAAEIPSYYIDELDKVVDEMVDKLVETDGVTVTKVSEEQAAKWREIAGPAVEEIWRERAGAMIDDPDAYLAEYKKVVAEKEAERPYVTGIDRYLAKIGQ